MRWIGVALLLLGGMLVFSTVIAVLGDWRMFYAGLGLVLVGGLVLFVGLRRHREG